MDFPPSLVVRWLFNSLTRPIRRGRHALSAGDVAAIKVYLAEFDTRRAFFAPYPEENAAAVVLSIEQFLQRTREFYSVIAGNPFAASCAGDILDKLQRFNDKWKPVQEDMSRRQGPAFRWHGEADLWVDLGALRADTRTFMTVLVALADTGELPKPEPVDSEAEDADGEGKPRAAFGVRAKAKGKQKARRPVAKTGAKPTKKR